MTAIAASVDFAAVIGGLKESVDSLRDSLERPGKLGISNKIISPTVRRLTAAKVTPASALTYTFIDCNPYGVPMGYLWDIRRIAITGPDPFTAVTGNAFPFIGNVPNDSATEPANFPDLIDVATTTIPNLSFWVAGQVILQGGEHLVVCLKSLPNNQQISVSFQVFQFLESDLASWVTR